MSVGRSALVIAALILTACSNEADQPAATEGAATTTTVAGQGTDSEAAASTTTTTTTTSTTTTTVPGIPRMPLTGEPLADLDDVPDRPALVVKISNAGPGVLPQSGLNEADLVIEEVINDRATRLAAVFHTTEADPVGPVRSGRAQDINLLRALNRPLFAWSGGNDSVTAAISESDLIDLDERRNPGFYRRTGKVAPNDLYSSTDALWAQTPEEAGRPGPLFPYLEPGEELEGAPATEVEITLDDVVARWVYDSEQQRYLRFQNDREHNTESAAGVQQVWADNVVVAKADYGINTFDGNPDAQILGSNEVFVFSRGTVRTGIWLRFDELDPFGFFDNVDDLNAIGLVPGRTWLEIPRNFDDVVQIG